MQRMDEHLDHSRARALKTIIQNGIVRIKAANIFMLHDRPHIKKILLYAYILFAGMFIVITGFGLRLSHLIPLLLPLAFIQGCPRRFLISWTPFYLLILLYDSFRGIADDLAARVEYVRLIQWDKFMFGGHVPTLWLQKHCMPLLMGWPGHVLAGFYFGHFVLPLVILYWTWRRNERAFLCCVSSLCFLCVSAFVSFFLFPAAPPWLAAQKGLLEPVQKLILYHIDLISCFLPRIYVSMNANPVAAFPSLHAAFPLLWFLCSYRYFSRKWVTFLAINALLVAFTIIAFGEHYVVDVLAGWFFALGSFFLAEYAIVPLFIRRGYLQRISKIEPIPAGAESPMKPINQPCF